MGHGGAGERSVGGGSPEIDKVEKSLSSVCNEAERPCREWWAVFGTATGALEGLGSCGLEAVVGAAPATEGLGAGG